MRVACRSVNRFVWQVPSGEAGSAGKDEAVSNVEATKTYSVPPVDRAIRLLRYIGDRNTCRNLSTAARDLGINRTTLIRLIHTLLDQRMIEEIGDGAGYRLGVGLISLGAQALDGRDIVQLCQPILQELCEATAMSAHLGILDGTDIVYLSRATPNSHLVSNLRAGARLRAHASSIGRAIIAEMTEADIRAIFGDRPLPAVTAKTPTTLDALLGQARADKAAGHAWSVGNFEAGIGSCAAAVFDHGGRVVAGLNVSGPESRFADTADGARIRDAVLDAARRASAALGGPLRA
ncbi:MAG: IclR family transcriptional regulator [Paracoccaceae bacterium]